MNVGYPCYSISVSDHALYQFRLLSRLWRGAVYEKHYAAAWPAEMELLPIGPFRVDEASVCGGPAGCRQRGHRESLLGRSSTSRRWSGFVRDLALSLPERKILLQVKSFFRNLSPSGRDYVRDCTDGLPNVIPVNDDVYDILKHVTYSVY